MGSHRINSSEAALALARDQAVLFAERPSRIELLKLKLDSETRPVAIRVHRNHSFEQVASVVPPWFALSGLKAVFAYSDYDDSLAFDSGGSEAAQLEMIWLDSRPYEGKLAPLEFSDWLAGRIVALRARTDAPILLVVLGLSDEGYDGILNVVQGMPGVRVADIRRLTAQLGAKFFDERIAKFSGSRLSDLASLVLARELACHWVPAMLLPRIKAVVLDLDNTLYKGVLGEDGVNVRLTPAHKALQEFLAGLRADGLFLAVVSRNEEAEAIRLFERRTDFPLRWRHFSAASVNWGEKAEGLLNVARKLRIGLDAVLFVDDNPGELSAVASELPSVATLHAAPDADLTRRALEYYPGLWAWERSAADAVRAADLEADMARDELAVKTVDVKKYLASLNVEILIETAPRRHLLRLYELSQKTNQFNLNLERFSEADLAGLFHATDHRIAAISLSDRLSDSGLIGLVVARLENDILIVRELAVSCRALGRRLEDLMIAETVRALSAALPVRRVKFLYRTGPRNGPARDWLGRLAGQALPAEGEVFLQDALARISAKDYPVAIKILTHETK